MKKIIMIAISALICLVGLLVLFLPSILSSEIGKNFLIRIIEQNFQSTVHIGDISFSWGKNQKVEHFHFEKNGEVLLKFDSLKLKTSFLNLLFQSGSLGETTLINPQLILAMKPPNVTASPTSRKAVEAHAAPKKGKSIWTDLSGNILIQNGLFAVQESGKEFIRIDEVDLKLNIDQKFFPIAILGSGKAVHNQLLGSFQVEGTVKSEKERLELETIEALQVEGEAHFNNFPVVGIDTLVTLVNPLLKGILLDALGDNLQLDLLFSKVVEGQNLSLQLRSPRMMLSSLADYKKGYIQLQNPMKIIWTIKPRLIQTLKPELFLSLIGDTHAEIDIDSLNLPFKNMKFSTGLIATKGKIGIQRGAFALTATKESLLLDQFDLSFSTNRLEELVQLSFQNIFRFSSFPQTKMEGTTSIREPLSKNHWITKLALFDLNMRNVPTVLVDKLHLYKDELHQWIGSSFDFALKRFEQEGQHHLLLSGDSPLFKLATSHFTIQEDLLLKLPTSFTYQINPNHWNELASPITVKGDVQDLLIPIKNNTVDWSLLKLNLNLKSQNVQFKNIFTLGNLQLPFLNMQFEGSPAHSLHLNGASQLDFAPETLGHSLFGQDIELKISGHINMRNALEISPLNIALNGKKFKSELEGSIESSTFVLKKPLGLEFLLEPEPFNPLLSMVGNFPLLAESTPFHLEIKPGTFPLKKGAFSQLELKANGAIATLKMVQPQSHFPFSFENVDLDFDLNGKKERSRIQLDAHAREQDQMGGTIELLVENEGKSLDFLNNLTHTQLRFNHLSTRIGDALLNMKANLPVMIGDWIDLYFEMQKKQQGQDIEVDVKSPYLTMRGSFTVFDKLELKNTRTPLKLEWKVSEAGYTAYKTWRNPKTSHSSPPFVIKDRANVQLTISPLVFPLKSDGAVLPKIDMNLYHAIFGADVSIDSLTFQQEQTKEVTRLDQFNLSIHKDKAPGPLTFQMQGKIAALAGKQSGQIKGEGKLDDFLTPQGQVNLENTTASLHATIQHLPTIFLDALFNMKNSTGTPPSAVLGDSVNASFDAELLKDNGKLLLDLHATHCHATLDGSITNGLLYLNQPLKATMTISPKMNEILAHSAKLTVTSMKNPIELFISEKGFSTSIKSLDLKETHLSYGRIDMGQIICRNTGSASDISGIFKMEGDQNLISLWFAPMEFSIQNGLMHVDRTEILYNRAYQVALWGDINFVRRYVDMTLGLTAQSLRAALGISGLDPAYVLQIPVQGPFNNVKIDKGTATSRIALLITRKQIAPQAGVWGQMFGAIGGLADDQSNVPPPKPPFPWQNILNLYEKPRPEKDLKNFYKKKAKAYQQEVKKFLR